MATTLVKNDLHIVFHVKSTSPLIRTDDMDTVCKYIAGIIHNNNGLAMEIGGMPDHIHILSSLPKTMSLSDYVRDIKTNSSRWIKTLDNHYSRFEWQEGYGAFSVSPSLLDKTVAYIKGQKEHHKKRTFREEYIMFLQASNIEYDERFFITD